MHEENGEFLKHSTAGKSHLRRNMLIGLALALILPPVLTKAAAYRLKKKHDTGHGEDLTAPLGEIGRHIKSFDGTSLYAEEVGSGPTLVFAHGWFENSTSWYYQKKELKSKYRIVCFDQRGHCRSEAGEVASYNMESLALDLKSVLDEYAQEPVVLAGHSMGGASVLEFTEMFPEELGERVKGIVLVDTANTPLMDCVSRGTPLGAASKPVVRPFFKWAVEHPDSANKAKNLVVGTSPFLVATRLFGFGPDAPLNQMEYIGDMVEMTSMKGPCMAGLSIIDQEGSISLGPLKDSHIPVMICVGDADKLTPPEVSRRMHQELPGSVLHVIEHARHSSFMEKFEQFNQYLDDFAVKAFSM